jgi:hypothetical protein
MVDDIPAEVDAQLARLKFGERIEPGQSVAITAGSRGIANIATVIRAAAAHLAALGAKPFIVPAMGSHGGGTPEGQTQLLADYGITEEFCGCPIRASMGTVIVCQAAEGFPVYFDRHAFEADHVLVVGRVKPHTNFVGEIESGLMKMMLIGLGKHEGAKTYHAAIFDHSFDQIVRSVAGEVLARCNILGGLALIENGYDETAKIEAVPPHQIESREPELLKLARSWMPRLPFEAIDILLIDQMGKNISGTGMDTNVVGRKYNKDIAVEGETPRVKQIVVRSLTPETHGNAIGIGMADFCTQRLVASIDWGITRTNALTAGHVGGVKLPLTYATDREILAAALPTIGLKTADEAGVCWIHNTLEVAELECSAVFLAEAQARDDLEVLCEPRPLEFDAAGNLRDAVVG